MKGVYIHIPFCNSICSYCDFCKFLYTETWAQVYLDALNDEVEEYYEGDEIKSIYIGGGTPSSLSKRNLEKLFKTIKMFKKSENIEFTYECNINDINEDLLDFLYDNGVNRLSIGVESFDEYNLKFLNRKHNKKDIFNKIKLAQEMGFENINVDLMYALPTESLSTLKSDVKKILKLGISHISTYSLIIEPHTAIYNKGIKCIDELIDYKMYKYICKKLAKNGYKHYEVSNFALKNYESKHNMIYWDNNEYYGFGVGAHGYINNMRYENTRNLKKYIDGEFRFDELLVSTQEEMENQVMLGLRKLDGISIKEFKERFEKNIFDVFKIQNALDKGYLVKDGDMIYIPEDKIYVMNEILNMIM